MRKCSRFGGIKLLPRRHGNHLRGKIIIHSLYRRLIFNQGSLKRCLNINDLPDELLLDIFSWFRKEELYFTIAPVCKKWYLLSRHSSLWRELCFTGLSVSLAKAASILGHSPSLQKLEIVEHPFVEEILHFVCNYNTQIRILKIKRCMNTRYRDTINTDLITLLLKRYQEQFNFIKNDKTHCVKYYRIIGSLLPHIHRENISSVYTIEAPEDVTRNFTDYRKLNFLPCASYPCTPKSGLEYTLRDLHLIVAELTDFNIEAVASCVNIRSLCLRYAANVTYEGMLKLEALKHLTSLDISMALQITSTSWCDLFSCFPWNNLQRLSICLCPLVDDDVLYSISKRCCSLEKLRLSGCILATADGVSKIIMKCQKLNYLNVYFTHVSTIMSFPLLPKYATGMKTLIYKPCTCEKEYKTINQVQESLPDLVIKQTDDTHLPIDDIC